MLEEKQTNKETLRQIGGWGGLAGLTQQERVCSPEGKLLGATLHWMYKEGQEHRQAQNTTSRNCGPQAPDVCAVESQRERKENKARETLNGQESSPHHTPTRLRGLQGIIRKSESKASKDLTLIC